MGNNIVDHSDVVGATPVGAAPTTVWYKTKFGSQNFSYQIWCLFCYTYVYNVFQKIYVHYEFNDNVIKYHGSVIPHDWDVNFQKFGGLPTVVAFWEN